MSEKLKKGDFVEIEYDGHLKEGNLLFDSTDEEKAKKNNIHAKNAKYGPIVICIGENQLMGKLDDFLIGSDIGTEKTVDLSAENAFGKKDAKLLRIVPMSVFKKENIQPMPGLQVSVDGMFGIVKTASGGRVIVDFNHPLSGKDVYYKIKVNRIVHEDGEKIASYISVALDIPKSMIGTKLEQKSIDVMLPFKLPVQIEEKLQTDIKRVVPGIEKLTFSEEKKQANEAKADKKDAHGRTPEDQHFGHNHS